MDEISSILSASITNIFLGKMIAETLFDNNTMAILMKLFAINMVARSLLGFCLRVRIFLLFEEPSSCNDFISFGSKEKKAISDPDMRAEHSSNINIITKIKTMLDGKLARINNK